MIQHKAAKITIAHINDTHSHFEPSAIQLHLPMPTELGETLPVYASCGGFSRVSSAVKDVKKQAYVNGRDFMFVHAGDCFQGTLYFSLYKGVANAKLLNAIGVEAMALGNHELDMGNQPVADFLDDTHFPLLAANWDLSQEDQSKVNPLRSKNNVYAYQAATIDKPAFGRYMLKDVDGEKIAFFGLAIENMEGIANPDPDTSFVNVVTAAKQTIEEIHRNGINKIVILSHLGYERDLQLAQEVEGIGAIIGGHTHTMQGDFSNLGYGVTDKYAHMVHGTCVVQAGCNAMSLGQLELDFNPDGTVASAGGKHEILLGRQFTLDATRTEHLEQALHDQVKAYLQSQPNVRFCVKDPEVENLLNSEYRPAVRQLQTQHITTVAEPLRHTRIPDAKGPSQIAPLVVDSFRWQGLQMGYDVDFAIHNAGGVRSSLNPGPLTAADIAGRLLPFAIGLMVYKVKGKYIRAALEGAIDNAIDNGVEGTGSGSFPYISNLRFTYRCCSAKGERVEELETYKAGCWQLIEDEAIYTSVSSGYTATGKEGYDALLNYEMEPIALNVTMAEAFEGYAASLAELSAPQEVRVNYIPCQCPDAA
ncbi:bifunctional metallophosphatase/5'-nucleotidase [Photobacterium jeanii]|uniref:Bifunctional metallophosphatase/5'-nucleotidase n=1 Tax=Photobacterium jeanii TaxID=858640 RepID=A0A178K332_9GAMM|nr:bifunctional UDP-sugar hydrolase/5'-nucleotidase [Photobacterium jeanii]OAN11506.1 bifunctional metallophosphatase/5'-nucleotidase [Photobacterium jeanii]